jgi:hypothetical protein
MRNWNFTHIIGVSTTRVLTNPAIRGKLRHQQDVVTGCIVLINDEEERVGALGLAELFDVLVEVDRVDSAFWGNCRAATIMRCILAENWGHGRPAKLMGIAATLGVGTSTVHDHVTRLSDPGSLPAWCEQPVLQRVPGGYTLTAYGQRRGRRWARAVARVLARWGAEEAAPQPVPAGD